MPEVSPEGGAVLCQGESGSGASLGASIACLTERFAAFSDGSVFRGDCCVLSESDPLAESVSWPVTGTVVGR